MSQAQWEVLVAPPARRQINRLPISVATAVLETLNAIASNPRRLGKPLRFELERYLSARRGPYRIIYRIGDAARSVTIVAVAHRAAAVAHRADAYRPR